MSVEPTSSKTTGYHIFIEPSGELAVELRSIIERLSAEHSSPVFAPHVTVLARIPETDESLVIERTKELAALLSPTTLTLGELATEPSYYRALYTRINEQELLTIYYERACDIFSLQKDPAYTPHLGLLYGNYEPEVVSEIRRALIFPQGATFTADKLHLYRTEGEVGQWYKVEEFPVSSSQNIFD